LQIIDNTAQLKKWVERQQHQANKIALVPTMGGLHAGHISLIKLAQQRAAQVVVSIFVNPTQFGKNEDFANYPQTLVADIALLTKLKVGVLFVPKVEHIYPTGMQTQIQLGKIGSILCGMSRKQHFQGVVQVVRKLFAIVQPEFAVFGEKDYQQLQVIKQMVKDLNLDIKIVGHPTVRETDGLAMSSSNTYLSPLEKKSALSLYKALLLAEKLIKEGEKEAKKIKKELEEFIYSFPFTRVQYIELVDPETLEPVEIIDKPVLCALAVYVGKARLIDNKIIVP